MITRKSRNFLSLLLCVLTISMAACLPLKTEETSSASVPGNQHAYKIRGALTLTKKAVFEQGTKAIITLNDISLADTPSVELARQEITLEEYAAPIKYDLSVNATQIKPGMRYAVRAIIQADNGDLLWTTDRINMIDTGKKQQDLAPLRLVEIPVRHSAKPTNNLKSTWTIHSIDEFPVVESHLPEISFSEHGKISGSTGCNRFTGDYKIRAQSIQLKKIAITRRACIPPLDQQEKVFTEILNAVESFTFDEAGHLALRASNGRFLKGSK